MKPKILENQLQYDELLAQLKYMDWDFKNADTGFLSHSFHPYPAKYIPQIPAAVINRFTAPGDTVLDVFAGSGTTLVEATRSGRNAIGVDANPLATLIARVKCRPLLDGKDAVRESMRCVEERVNNHYGRATLSAMVVPDKRQAPLIMPPIADLDFWFPKSAQNELAIIKEVIDTSATVTVREFLQVAFSSIIVNVSYQDSDTRYTRRDKGLKEGETTQRWLARLKEMLSIMNDFDALPNLGNVSTLTIDSRCLSGIRRESVDLAITSPPYPNAYSYHLYHRFRMEWLGYDQPRFKQEEIGSHRKYSAKGVKGATAETFRAEMVDVLKGIYHVLKPEKLCVLVVGDSIVRGIKVDNADLIRSAAVPAGFCHIMTMNRNILSSKKSFNPSIGKIKQEHIVVLKKP